jgi:hypothetical protein
MVPVFDLSAEGYKKAMTDAIAAEGKKNLKKEKEVSHVQGQSADFDTVMKQAKAMGVKFHKAERMPELVAIVEKHFGVGKKLIDATPMQLESLIIAVQEMEDVITKA